MRQSPPTRASLLIRLRDGKDQIAWNEFVEIYGPLIYGFACSKGLQDADSADVVQDVISIVAKQMPRFEYDPGRGSFRGWLFTVAINSIRQAKNKEKKSVRGSGDTVMQQVLAEQPDPDDEQARWENQYQQHLFRWAAEQVRREIKPHTWKAFFQFAVEQKPVSQVAEDLAMSVGAVYIAKSRVIDRIRTRIQAVEENANV